MSSLLRLKVRLAIAVFSLCSSLAFALTPISADSFSKGVSVEQPANGLKIYPLLPLKAQQEYKIDLFDSEIFIAPHFHTQQTQFLVILEGKASFRLGAEEKVLGAGDFVVVPAGTTHAITPLKEVRFLSVDMPGFDFPQDTTFDEKQFADAKPAAAPFVYEAAKKGPALAQLSTKLEVLPPAIPPGIPAEYFLGKPLEVNEKDRMTVYDLGAASDKSWSLSVIELLFKENHFHKLGSEHFLVLNGELNITLTEEGKDPVSYSLLAGQSVHVPPGVKHELSSRFRTPVRLLVVDLPAFDPTDTHVN